LARYLALDWDHKQLRIVSATVSGRVVRIEKAVLIEETQSPNPAEAEVLGQRLRDHLKTAGIAAAPVLACLGRDRLILKEVRYPQVSAAEEPAVVRFQTTKELTGSIDEVIIDFAPISESVTGGEKRSLALIARRELLAAHQTVCRAAGLKLEALVPRPFGTLAALKQSLSSSAAAVLAFVRHSRGRFESDRELG
jgi:Tfp pilus assembly PilM family ATPase